MEVSCYVCNKNTIFYQQNLTEIKSNHSGKRICDFIKQFARDIETNRNVDDESNCICGDCLQRIYMYDWVCVEAVKRENTLIQLLSATEMSLSEQRVEIKVEKDAEICHTESVFVEENHGLTGEIYGDGIEIKTEPEHIDECDVLMDETLNSQDAIENPTEETQNPNRPLTEKTIFIQKDGRLVKVKLVRQGSDDRLTNLLRTKNGKIVTIKLGENQTVAQTLQPGMIQNSETPVIKRIFPQRKVVVPSNVQNPAPIALPDTAHSLVSINVMDRISSQTAFPMQIQQPADVPFLKQSAIPNPKPMPSQAEIQRQIEELESSIRRRKEPLKTFTRECKICDDGTKYSKKGYYVS